MSNFRQIPPSPRCIRNLSVYTYNGIDYDISVAINNRGSNRYFDVLPFNNNRVVIKGQNDYINASHIGFVKDQKIIAAQGPTKNTINTFLKMLIQEKVSLIVNCVDKEDYKFICNNSLESQIKIITKEITLEGAIPSPHYSLYDMQVSYYGRRYSFNYIIIKNWPEISSWCSSSIFGGNGMNSATGNITANSLASIVGKMHSLTYRDGDDSTPGPIVVSCKAGNSRTGIVISTYIKHYHNTNFTLSDTDIVTKMRECRMGCLQTEEQYALFTSVTKKMIEDESKIKWVGTPIIRDTFSKIQLPKRASIAMAVDRDIYNSTNEELISLAFNNNFDIVIILTNQRSSSTFPKTQFFANGIIATPIFKSIRNEALTERIVFHIEHQNKRRYVTFIYFSVENGYSLEFGNGSYCGIRFAIEKNFQGAYDMFYFRGDMKVTNFPKISSSLSHKTHI